MKRTFLILVLVFALSGSLLAELSLLEFTGTLTGKTPDGDITILALQVTPTTSIDVRVTDLTEIKDGLDAKTVDDLMDGMILKIEAFHTSEGFTAREIEITDGAALIEVRGEVTAKTDDPDTLTVATLVLHVNENTSIKDFERPSNKLTFDDIMVHDFVKIEAFPSGDHLVAASIKVGDPEDRFARLAFEGIIDSIDGDIVMVSIDSVADPIPVLITPDTEVKGVLAVGLRVTVIGHLNSDLMVVADKIIVKKLLHLAPKKVKLKTNDSRQIQIILNEVLGEDLVLTIASNDPSLVTVDPTSVTIPAGELSAFFHVHSADQEGETTVTATAGDLVASAEVEVRDGGNGPPFDIVWHPGHVNGHPGQIRKVKLQLGRAVDAETIVTITQTEGEPDLLADYPSSVTFLPGEKKKDVIIVLGDHPGEGKLVAEMPEGQQAEFEIKIR